MKPLSRRFLVSMAAAGALIGGAFFARPSVVLADTGITLADSNTFMLEWHMNRLGAGVISCGGVCRTSTASNTYIMRCPVTVANQATAGACLTALAAACTPTACASP